MLAGEQAVPERPTLMQRLLRSNGPLRVRLNLGLLLLFIFAGLLAPLLPLHDPVTPYPLNRLKPPSAEHPFGTDGNGMDVLSRTIFAIRTDFALALARLPWASSSARRWARSPVTSAASWTAPSRASRRCFRASRRSSSAWRCWPRPATQWSTWC